MQKLGKHMRENPEAAKLIAEHVIAPLLVGKEPSGEDKPEGNRSADY